MYGLDITFGPGEFAALFWYLCGLPVGIPTLAGMLAGAVVRGRAPRRGCGVGLLVGIASAPLTVAGNFLISVWIESHFPNVAWLLWQLLGAVPTMLFAILAAYLVWRKRRST